MGIVQVAVRLSIVIPSYNSATTIERCLRSLAIASAETEIVVVDSSTDGTVRIVAEKFPQVRLIHSETRMYPGDARNAGAALAGGDIFAFLDADTAVAPDWAVEVARVHGGPYAAVGGSLLNANPESLVGWAHYLFEFSAWLPHGVDREQNEIPGGCLSITREDFARYGPFPGHTYSEDSVLSWRMRAAGERLLFAPAIRVFHVNREDLLGLLRDKCRHGRDFAAQRAVSSRLLYAFGAPALPLLLIWRIASRVRPHAPLRRCFWRVCPLIAALAVAWSFGEFCGYLNRPNRLAQEARNGRELR